jgi:hypothetical protein
MKMFSVIETSGWQKERFLPHFRRFRRSGDNSSLTSVLITMKKSKGWGGSRKNSGRKTKIEAQAGISKKDRSQSKITFGPKDPAAAAERARKVEEHNGKKQSCRGHKSKLRSKRKSLDIRTYVMRKKLAPVRR